MKLNGYAYSLALDALEICTNVRNKYSRIDAIRDIDPKSDDNTVNIAQMMMMLIVTINHTEQ